jgi:hypothetical protein
MGILKHIAPLFRRDSQPNQLALDSIMNRVRSVRVLKGGCAGDTLLDPTVLVEVNEPTQVTALRLALKIIDGSGGHCMCYGGQHWNC